MIDGCCCDATRIADGDDSFDATIEKLEIEGCIVSRKDEIPSGLNAILWLKAVRKDHNAITRLVALQSSLDSKCVDARDYPLDELVEPDNPLRRTAATFLRLLE